MKFLLLPVLLISVELSTAQDNLLSLLDSTSKPKKEFVTSSFKSSRVINGQSMEMLGKNVLDVRILHRFGLVNTGAGNFFGLDQASMRLGFDYGISRNFTIGVGRSTLGKELDGFLKFRMIQQATGAKGASPVSLLGVVGSTITTAKFPPDAQYTSLTYRMGYFSELIVGRKFSEGFSLQLSPVYVHRNKVLSPTDLNDTYALGIGSRLKLSKRVAFVGDYHYLISGIDKDIYRNPLSLGFDIETGGHVFQLHFSNSAGMNEKAFLTSTTDSWGKGEVRFGFNLSRVFTLGKKSEKKKWN